MTVGFGGVLDLEADGLDREHVPGLVRRGRRRLRVARAADMGHTQAAPSLTQRHTLPVANATVAPSASGTGISKGAAGLIGTVPATMGLQADGIGIDRTSEDIHLPGLNQDVEFGADVAAPRLTPTPSLGLANATTGHQAVSPTFLVGAVLHPVNADQGHTDTGTGFGDRSQRVVNAIAIMSVAAPKMTKHVLTGVPSQGHTSTVIKLTRLYALTQVNATQGHTATASGVTPAAISMANATTGHSALVASIVYLARTFPLSGIQDMIVIPPTMSQNIVNAQGAVPTFFGSQIGADSAGALQIGNVGVHPNATSLAIRFRAVKTATVNLINVLTHGGAGFTLGDGVLEGRILRDSATSAHLPLDSQRTGTTPDASTTVTYTGTSAHVGAVSDRLTVSALAASASRSFVWSSGNPVLTRNNIYHFEIRNVHNDPDNNFPSLTTLFMSSAGGQNPLQPGIESSDLGMSFRGITGIWSARANDVPIFGVQYVAADFDNQGQGYRDVKVSSNPITGPSIRVRQTYKPDTDLRVHTIGYRIARWTGSQPLQVRLRRENDNSIIVSAAADHAYFPIVTNQADPRPENRWYHNTFVSSFSLAANVTAALEFQTTANAEYRTNVLHPAIFFGVTAAFYQGRAEFTNDAGANWAPILSSGATNHNTDLPFYFRLGSAAPGPICADDSFVGGFTIGGLRTVSAAELVNNDYNPSGISATSTLLTGTNPLVLHSVGSASNCTATLVSNTVRVTALASAGSFLYVARDIYSQKSTARASFLPPVDTGPAPTGIREIWFYTPNSLSTSILLAYNARATPIVYQSSIPDSTDDGIWDGKTSSYNSKLNGISSSDTGPIALDWESVPNCTYGIARMASGFAGFGNPTVTARQRAQTEALRALNAWQGDRPNARWGFYWTPTMNNWVAHYINNSTDFQEQETEGQPIWAEVNCIFPRMYPSLQEGSTTSLSGGTMTRADLQIGCENVALLSLKCAAIGGNNAQVFPFISRHYYVTGGVTNPFFQDTLVPLEWLYLHAFYFTQKTLNGKRAQGVYIWDKGSSSSMTEAQLSAIYQGLNGFTPYNPSFPRP